MAKMYSGAILLLVITLAYATVTDLQYRRIPNRLTLPMLAGSLVLHAVHDGQAGLTQSLTGAGVGLLIMIVPYTMSWVGGGDVKLVMVVGALMGSAYLLTALLFASLVAGAIALVEVVRKRQLVSTVRYFLLSWYLPIPKSLALKTKLPYAPAVACGCVMTFAMAAATTFHWLGM